MSLLKRGNAMGLTAGGVETISLDETRCAQCQTMTDSAKNPAMSGLLSKTSDDGRRHRARGTSVGMAIPWDAPGRIDLHEHVRQPRALEDLPTQRPIAFIVIAELRHENERRRAARAREHCGRTKD